MYVAAKGGEQAIQNAEQFYGLLNGPLTLEAVRLIQERLPYLVDRVMGEGSLYSPELAATARNWRRWRWPRQAAICTRRCCCCVLTGRPNRASPTRSLPALTAC